MRKLMSLLLVCVLLVGMLTVTAAADRADRIRFVPVEIVTSQNEAKVKGYFINMNEDVSVGNFKEFEMEVYYNDELVLSGSFGEINQFMISPLRMKYQTFTFTGDHGLKEGTFSCDDDCFTKITCKFSSREKN